MKRIFIVYIIQSFFVSTPCPENKEGCAVLHGQIKEEKSKLVVMDTIELKEILATYNQPNFSPFRETNIKIDTLLICKD